MSSSVKMKANDLLDKNVSSTLVDGNVGADCTPASIVARESKKVSGNQLMEMEQQYGAHNYSSLPLCALRAKGVWVYDENNKPYLDLMSAYSAVSLGHSNRDILEVLINQAQNLCVTSRAYFNNQLPIFLMALSKATGFDKALPMNTGAEAVETAIKCARKWGHKVKGIKEGAAQIIVCEQNFHGRTSTIVGFSSEPQYREGFGPFSGGFVKIPFSDSKALETAINGNTCAFLFEPIQGEAGIVLPHDGYLKEVREICSRHNVLMIADEVQSGLMRTGRSFAFEHEGVRPDALILGKALGGGILPISAFCANDAVMSVFNPGDHGSTFGGNPLACAIATKSLELLLNQERQEHVEEVGNYFKEKLLEKIAVFDSVKEVRGRGLFIAIELKAQYKAMPVVLKLLKEGLISKDTHGQVIRIAPALTITKKQIDYAIMILEKVFKEL